MANNEGERGREPVASARTGTDARARAIAKVGRERGHGHARQELHAEAPAFFAAGGAGRSSKSVEHNTPLQVVEALYRATGLDCFGTDPCAPSDGGGHVRAAVKYTKEDNGLAQEWSGVAFVNPPYGRGQLAKWLSKAAREFAAGRVPLAIMLIPARTGARWFVRLVFRAGHDVIFLEGRLHFNDAGPATFDSCIVLMGATRERAAAIAAAFPGSHYVPGSNARRAA